jgi:hypothetical protein
MTALVGLYRVDHQSLVAWVCRTYGIGDSPSFDNPHRKRREAIATRLRLYRDQATLPVACAIDQIYETDEMKATLKRYIDVALEENVSSRIVNEVASLYDRPALRTLAARNEEFHAEEKRLSLHFVHQEAHRLTNLCNEVLLWQFRGIDDKTALRIITPDNFDAVPDPRDTLQAAGFLLDAPRATALGHEAAQRLPRYELWDDTYRYLINGQGRMVDETGEIVVEPLEHGLKRIPGVLFHRREPTVSILDATYGEDIKSAHIGVALLNVMIMRLSKSQGENQPVLQGNLAAMATGQVMNGEKPLLLPPEVVASMLSMKTDPDHYLSVKKDKVTSVARRYGIGYEQYSLQETSDSASGKAYAARREKLTEIRMEQRGRAVKHEEAVADLMGFEGIEIDLDFQEQAIPQDAKEEIELLDVKMRKGLDSPVTYMQRKDPDLTRDEAKQKILDNLEDFAMLVVAARALNAPMGADAGNPGQSPQENGANNAPRMPGTSDAQSNDPQGDTQMSSVATP